MSLTLKFRVLSNESVKTLRFPESMYVVDVLKTVFDKTATPAADRDGLGLFKPLTEGTIKGGRWFKPDKTLESYELRDNDVIEVRKKNEAIKIKLVDGTQKTQILDLSGNPEEVVSALAKKIGLKNPEEYSLMYEADGEWLKRDNSVLEQLENLSTSLVLKKKYFVNDTQVDQHDPVQLHLMYLQCRDDILASRHPTAKDEAINLAALQCQIDYGNIILSSPQYEIKKVLSVQWHKEKNIEKQLVTEWKKLNNMTEMNAKFRYVQFARSLKTYGLTIFHVKERKGKKLSDLMIGFTRDSIMRFDVDVKVDKTWPLIYLKRWAASADTFTMDFGSHETDYVTFVTEEGEKISQLIAGYIEILLKRVRDMPYYDEDEDNANYGTFAPLMKAAVKAGLINNTNSWYETIGNNVENLESAGAAIAQMARALLIERVAIEENNGLTPAQKRQHVTAQQKNVEVLTRRLVEMLSDPNGNIDKDKLNMAAKQLASAYENMLLSFRNAQGIMGATDDENYWPELLDAVNACGESIQRLVQAAAEAAKNPKSVAAQNKLKLAHAEVKAGFIKLDAMDRGVWCDDSYQKLYRGLGVAVGNAAENVSNVTSKFKLQNPAKQGAVTAARDAVVHAGKTVQAVACIFAPTGSDPKCRAELQAYGNFVADAMKDLVSTLKLAGIADGDNAALLAAVKQLNLAMQGLVGCIDLPNIKGGRDAQLFTDACSKIIESTTAILAGSSRADVLQEHAKLIEKYFEVVKRAVPNIADDPINERHLKEHLNKLGLNTRALLAVIPDVIANPTNQAYQIKLRNAAQAVANSAEVLKRDGGQKIATAALYASAKSSAASLAALLDAANKLVSSMQDMGQITQQSSEALNNLLASIKSIPASASGEIEDLDSAATILVDAIDQFAPTAASLIAACKGATPRITDPLLKKQIALETETLQREIQELMAAKKAAKASLVQYEIVTASETFDAATAELDAALIALQSGRLRPSSESRDVTLPLLLSAVRAISNGIKNVCETSRDAPEEIGAILKSVSVNAAELVANGKSLASVLTDPAMRKGVLVAIQELHKNMNNVYSTARTNITSPQLPQLLNQSAEGVEQSIKKIIAIAGKIAPTQIEDYLNNAATDIEDLAERELKQASNVITSAIQRLKRAQEEARAARQAQGIDLAEIEIADAIMDAVNAIGQSTNTLVIASAAVQADYNKLSKAEGKTTIKYKRDPAWAKGLISCAQQVAAAVSHLVHVSDQVTRGEASEEALIVASKTVAAETTKLVAATTVKQTTDASVRIRLTEAAKLVNQATRDLQQAAINASDFKQEKQEVTKGEKFKLQNSKIQEMEQQIEILRMERELEKKKAALLAARKKEYETKDEPKEEPAPETTGKVNWRKSRAFGTTPFKN